MAVGALRRGVEVADEESSTSRGQLGLTSVGAPVVDEAPEIQLVPDAGTRVGPGGVRAVGLDIEDVVRAAAPVLVRVVLDHISVESHQTVILVHMDVVAPIMSNIPLGVIDVRSWNPILLLTVVSNDQPAVRIDLSGTGVNRVFFHPGEVRLVRSDRPDIEAPVELLAPVADGGVGSAAPP